MKRIAVTGGIASGKSTISGRLREHGAHVLDADLLAREVVEPGEPALEQIVARFGEDVLRADGSLDRAGLAARVFGDAEQLRVLNSIIHPAVHARVERLTQKLAEADPDSVIVYDVPLLVESANEYAWDLVVVADAPEEIRIKRMVELRGMGERDARARIANQASDAQRRGVADVIIDTSGTYEWTLEQTDRLWETLRADASNAS